MIVTLRFRLTLALVSLALWSAEHHRPLFRAVMAAFFRTPKQEGEQP